MMAHLKRVKEFHLTILSFLDTGKVAMSNNIFLNFSLLVPNFLHVPKMWSYFCVYQPSVKMCESLG